MRGGCCQAEICKTILRIACPFEMLLTCSHLPKRKDAVDDGFEAHKLSNFRPPRVEP